MLLIMNNIYSNNDMDDLYFKFYEVVNNIIYDIHANKINNFLFKCNYNYLNGPPVKDKINLPLTICLGGGGFILYNYIFKNEKLLNTIKLSSRDYDMSFSLKYISKENITVFIKEINNICINALKKFKYKNITHSNFYLTHTTNLQRLHFRIECDPFNNKKNVFHILELSFWLNGKISDNFTVNDFYMAQLYLYKYNEMYFYLLPLELLVKTMLYAITDYFEKRNFNKCLKYIERIKFIKQTNDKFIKQYNSKFNYCINKILGSYKDLIKRKYKLINDYPFILAKPLSNIDNNGIVKCIYREFRKNNNTTLNTLIDEFKNKCKDKKKYNKQDSEVSIDNTEEYDQIE